jgi:uncharacterized protein (DUF1501 family)
MSGFDTAVNQLPRQQALFRDLSEAMSAFQQSTVELGIASRVTTFTDTEFNRTLAPNAKGGSDPGWGGHHLVMGSAVLGGEVHGEFPSLTLNGRDDATGTGVWAPSVGKDDFSAAVAEWMGVDVAGSPQLFPALDRAASSNLRFLA